MDKSLASTNVDYTRWELSVGAEYRIGDVHEFHLFTRKAVQMDDGFQRYHSGRIEHNEDVAISQDDLMIRLRYSYKF